MNLEFPTHIKKRCIKIKTKILKPPFNIPLRLSASAIIHVKRHLIKSEESDMAKHIKFRTFT